MPLRKIELEDDARPVKVRFQNYFQEQNIYILKSFVAQLVKDEIAYPGPTYSWVKVPLLVPKTSPAKFRFTANLRPVNKITVKHRFSMPHIEQKVTKLAVSKCFSTFHLVHG